MTTDEVVTDDELRKRTDQLRDPFYHELSLTHKAVYLLLYCALVDMIVNKCNGVTYFEDECYACFYANLEKVNTTLTPIQVSRIFIRLVPLVGETVYCGCQHDWEKGQK